MALRIALFDLDHTLLAGDSDYEWGQFLVRIGAVDGEAYAVRNQGFYADYLAGTLDIHAFLDFQLAPLARYPRQKLDQWHRQFMREQILPIIDARARAEVDRQIACADLVAIITATNSFVTAPIAREFGVPHLIATEPEAIDGQFTGRVAGIPCFREGKIRRLESFLAERGIAWQDIAASCFYSDSHNDLPLLEKVSHPVAVNPDDTLRATALARGWPILALH